ncbi:hypothetical protein PR048_017699 [Dryococelus australis]|uniref:Uncharacterized protein n=1 Tax=Dryococelus australis TaxID=614101 RepID=A0ABQ9HAC0_9NEOP|nr:hypothetical protein PR048_017699 [Dryococelus australis]
MGCALFLTISRFWVLRFLSVKIGGRPERAALAQCPSTFHLRRANATFDLGLFTFRAIARLDSPQSRPYQSPIALYLVPSPCQLVLHRPAAYGGHTSTRVYNPSERCGRTRSNRIVAGCETIRNVPRIHQRVRVSTQRRVDACVRVLLQGILNISFSTDDKPGYFPCSSFCSRSSVSVNADDFQSHQHRFDSKRNEYVCYSSLIVTSYYEIVGSNPRHSLSMRGAIARIDNTRLVHAGFPQQCTHSGSAALPLICLMKLHELPLPRLPALITNSERAVCINIRVVAYDYSPLMSEYRTQKVHGSGTAALSRTPTTRSEREKLCLTPWQHHRILNNTEVKQPSITANSSRRLQQDGVTGHQDVGTLTRWERYLTTASTDLRLANPDLRDIVSMPSDDVLGAKDVMDRDGNTARLERRSDEALEVRVSVARIAPSLLGLGRAAPSHSRIVQQQREHQATDRQRKISGRPTETKTQGNVDLKKETSSWRKNQEVLGRKKEEDEPESMAPPAHASNMALQTCSMSEQAPGNPLSSGQSSKQRISPQHARSQSSAVNQRAGSPSSKEPARQFASVYLSKDCSQ